MSLFHLLCRGIAEVPENTPSEVTTDTYSTTTAPADSTTGEVDYYIASYPYQVLHAFVIFYVHS